MVCNAILPFLVTILKRSYLLEPIKEKTLDMIVEIYVRDTSKTNGKGSLRTANIWYYSIP